MRKKNRKQKQKQKQKSVQPSNSTAPKQLKDESSSETTETKKPPSTENKDSSITLFVPVKETSSKTFIDPEAENFKLLRALSATNRVKNQWLDEEQFGQLRKELLFQSKTKETRAFFQSIVENCLTEINKTALGMATKVTDDLFDLQSIKSILAKWYFLYTFVASYVSKGWEMQQQLLSCFFSGLLLPLFLESLRNSYYQTSIAWSQQLYYLLDHLKSYDVDLEASEENEFIAPTQRYWYLSLLGFNYFIGFRNTRTFNKIHFLRLIAQAEENLGTDEKSIKQAPKLVKEDKTLAAKKEFIIYFSLAQLSLQVYIVEFSEWNQRTQDKLTHFSTISQYFLKTCSYVNDFMNKFEFFFSEKGQSSEEISNETNFCILTANFLYNELTGKILKTIPVDEEKLESKLRKILVLERLKLFQATSELLHFLKDKILVKAKKHPLSDFKVTSPVKECSYWLQEIQKMRVRQKAVLASLETVPPDPIKKLSTPSKSSLTSTTSATSTPKSSTPELSPRSFSLPPKPSETTQPFLPQPPAVTVRVSREEQEQSDQKRKSQYSRMRRAQNKASYRQAASPTLFGEMQAYTFTCMIYHSTIRVYLDEKICEPLITKATSPTEAKSILQAARRVLSNNDGRGVKGKQGQGIKLVDEKEAVKENLSLDCFWVKIKFKGKLANLVQIYGALNRETGEVNFNHPIVKSVHEKQHRNIKTGFK